MSNHTVCFYGEIRKIIPELSPNTPLTIPLGHSLPNADSRRSVVSFWRKNVHNTG